MKFAVHFRANLCDVTPLMSDSFDLTVFMLSGTGPDGVTRGAFSYLDDKGVQRSIQYIAGAGIGE